MNLNIDNVQAYPLQWPVTTPRTPETKRKSKLFSRVGWDTCIQDLRYEVERLGGKHLVISTNQPVRRDGMPFAQARRIDDPGVAVYFVLDAATVCFPSDRFHTLGENLRAVVMHLEAMRGMERWGVGTAKQAFAGYKALPAVASEEPWWDVLQCKPDATREVIQQQFRALARFAHPDIAGSEDAMARLNAARDRALAEKGSRA